MNGCVERIREDRPITIKDDKWNTSKLIAEIVALFITAMDKLKLDMRSMDDLHGELKVSSSYGLGTAQGQFKLWFRDCSRLVQVMVQGLLKVSSSYGLGTAQGWL